MTESKNLQNKCKYLIERKIFRPGCFPCVFCKSSGKLNTWKIERAHILRRSDMTKYKWQILNILPLCQKHHTLLHEDKEAEDKFFFWLEENLPLHFVWWEQHKNERHQTIPLSYWQGLHKELQYYSEYPNEAYKKVFEQI